MIIAIKSANDFKKFINALRKNNEPLNLSINKAIDEYYSLDKYPDILIDIPNVNLIDDKQLSEYLQYISSFTSSIEDLKCNYLDHPFYFGTHQKIHFVFY